MVEIDIFANLSFENLINTEQAELLGLSLTLSLSLCLSSLFFHGKFCSLHPRKRNIHVRQGRYCRETSTLEIRLWVIVSQPRF